MGRSAWQPLLLAAALGVAALPALAQATRTVGKFGSWTVIAHEAQGTRLCFATMQPSSSEPAGANRDVVHFYISAWPREGVKTEVSVKVGYPVKKGSTVTVTIGTTVFNLFVANDRAFVADATQELKLVEAMKKGSMMMVEGVSERGTQTKDVYSLSGLTQALQAVTNGCG